MYICPEMIDMGLEEGSEWPSDAHRVVAQTLGIGNPNIVDWGTLRTICQSVVKVPQERIKKVTYEQLKDEFDLPPIA